jgi:hypothetical protein
MRKARYNQTKEGSEAKKEKGKKKQGSYNEDPQDGNSIGKAGDQEAGNGMAGARVVKSVQDPAGLIADPREASMQ